MSKESENKEKQGFQKKCPCCGNCANYICEVKAIKEEFCSRTYYKEKNLRCAIGGFAISKSNWCRGHEFKQ